MVAEILIPSYCVGLPCRTYPYCLRLAAWYEELIIPAAANLKIFQVASNSLNHKKD
ncbi:hypothetical protein EIKCOROL_00894 [Eikenella corrodens ATCC 23834]|uniref:Uncharacterized protein n=1 Tax=Eikenella corrodens ATCC 23834 TaxID=546274 RepID=C0DU63_EIKCO|nr:hypothetical protein EIKCOROL_00894 [Eikenella corrodens ATCC 23834]